MSNSSSKLLFQAKSEIGTQIKIDFILDGWKSKKFMPLSLSP